MHHRRIVLSLAGLLVVVLAAMTPALARAIDTDNDGVKDRRDHCPATPIGAKVDRTGCPIDADTDGVADGIDRCSRTQSGWPVDHFGCPVDEDLDGVVDAQDSCSGTLKDATVDARGCPIDSDGDAVYDGLDRCAGTTVGYRVDAYGCPVDTDHDGVNDTLDQCAASRPHVQVDMNGCQVKAAPLFEGTQTIVLDGVTFEKNKLEPTPESLPIIEKAALALMDWPEGRIEVAAHTDRAGTSAGNLALSRRRAEFVKNILITMGIEPQRLVAKGYGERKPIVQGTSPDATTTNRRIELARID